MRYTVKNQGGWPSNPPSYVSVYLSKNTTITTGDVYLMGVKVGGALGLYPGQNVTLTVSPTIPTSTAIGYYYIGMIADASNYEAESNEKNNTRSTSGRLYVYQLY